MIVLLLAQLAAAASPAEPDRAASCLRQAQGDPAAAERAARGWLPAGGTQARTCLALALVRQDRFAEAADMFAQAARLAELARDPAAAEYWAQSGNAWLAGGDGAKARGALDAALAAGTLDALQRGEAHLDRTRALVSTGDLRGARTDIDRALKDAADDPSAWLLSATLARRMGDTARSGADIAQALRRAGDDAAVQLEAGNIAALAGERDKAAAAWREARRIAPESPAGRSATNALSQFDASETSK